MFLNMQLPNRFVIYMALLLQTALHNFLFSTNGHLLETVWMFMLMVIKKKNKYIFK